jgi:hypothetical protein
MRKTPRPNSRITFTAQFALELRPPDKNQLYTATAAREGGNRSPHFDGASDQAHAETGRRSRALPAATGLIDKYARLQILHIADLLTGKQIAFPRVLHVTFKRAPKARKAAEEKGRCRWAAAKPTSRFNLHAGRAPAAEAVVGVAG